MMSWYTRMGALACVAVAVGLCTATVAYGATSPVRASPTNISFGAQPAGSETTRVVTFTNVTDEPVRFGYVSLFISGDPIPQVFDISVTTCIPPSDPNLPPNEDVTLDPGESCSWEITFRPGATDGREVYEAVFDYVAVQEDEWLGQPPGVGMPGHYAVKIKGATRGLFVSTRLERLAAKMGIEVEELREELGRTMRVESVEAGEIA
jgi:hypothetical protein